MSTVVRDAIRSARYQMSLSRSCQACGGEGWLTSSYSAAHPQGDYNAAHTPAVSAPTRCDQCTNGFQFMHVSPSDFMEWVIQMLEDYSKNNPESFYKMFIESVQERIVKGTPP